MLPEHGEDDGYDRPDRRQALVAPNPNDLEKCLDLCPTLLERIGLRATIVRPTREVAYPPKYLPHGPQVVLQGRNL